MNHPRVEFDWNRTTPGCVAFDLSEWTQVDVTGPDRRSFLHSFCTQDIKSLADGAATEAFLPSIKGRILAHALVWALPDRLRLFSVPGVGEVLAAHLRKYLLGVDAEIEWAPGSQAAWMLAGPAAPEVLASFVQVDSLPGKDQCVAANDPADTILCGPTPMLRIPHYVVAGAAAAVSTQVDGCMREQVGFGSPELLDQLRIEAGFPWHGRDISEEHLAQEAARTEQAISFRKGCYLGQEPIARLDALGHTNRELRGVHAVRGVIATGAEVRVGGNVIGHVSSAARTPEGYGSAGLAMLKRPHVSPGLEVTVESASGPIAAAIFWPSMTPSPATGN